jgi:lipopolysaccharide heptosyltransferase I
VKRLLIVKLSSIGDVLHALPVVKSIKKELPDLFIGWVVRQRCADLVQDAEFLDVVHVIPDKPNVADLIRLRKVLHAERYDTAFDMQGLFLSGLVAALSGAPRRIGLNRNREQNALFLTDPSVEGNKPLTHAVDVLLGFRQAAGLGPIGELPELTHLGTNSEQWLTGLALRSQLGDLVVLNVGASTVYKRWPVDNWIDLSNDLNNIGCQVVLTSGPSEKDDADTIEKCILKKELTTNLGGMTTQTQLAALLSHCDLVVTGDTGPMHLAAASGTPVVALFGPTDPRLTGPYGASHKVIWKQLPCSPCFRHPTCGGRVDCLKAISVTEVFDTVRALLAAGRESGAAA